MNIHEYQAKILLRQYGIPIPDFSVVSTMQELQNLINEKNLDQAVIKIQVHAGGRGKAGGVKVAHNRKDIQTFAEQMMGMKVVNNQTGPQGVIAQQLMITSLVPIKREYYMGAIIDRKKAQATLIVSPAGGIDIEEVAVKSPDQILTLPITSEGTIRSYNLQRLVKFMGWNDEIAKEGKKIALALAKAFVEKDASLIEINPLVETKEGHLTALDAKISIDDNALFRQPEIASFYDPSQHTNEEIQARTFDLAYVALDGYIGCMVNGAGLAMATMDIIQLKGGAPANFLDVGGGASEQKVAEGFKIILSDPKVRAILINIFGGIMNCETLAAGIIAASEQLQVKVPLVVRMEGTNVEQGRKRLMNSGLKIVITETLTEAAEKVVEVANQRK